MNNYGNIDVKIYDTEDYVSKKRNIGISKANSENIIIIDEIKILKFFFTINLTFQILEYH